LVWRFGRMDLEGQFGCHLLRFDDVGELETELKTFQEEPIWALRKRKWLKFVGIDEMTADGRRRLEAVNKQEDGLWQLHLGRYKWRIWGYFEDPEFYFFWWDNSHAVATGKWRNRASK
jgi:hypothetical protein